MRRAAALLVLTVGVLLAGYLLGGSSPTGEDPTGRPASDPHAHSHADREPREVDPPYPSLSVEVVRERDRRVLKLRTNHFSFVAPGETAPDAGHAGHGHLEVDDESLAMFYGPRYVLPRFQPGTYTLRVTLNGTDHAPLAVDDRVVADTVTLEVTRTMPAFPGRTRSDTGGPADAASDRRPSGSPADRIRSRGGGDDLTVPPQLGSKRGQPTAEVDHLGFTHDAPGTDGLQVTDGNVHGGAGL